MENSELIKEGNGSSDTAIFAFGGCALQIGGVLPFEFVGTVTKNFPEVDTYFYVDRNQCWYHKGLRGINSSVDEIVEHLKEKASNYKKTLFIGNSSGGYAALLFGSLVGADVCLSFNPQTDLNLIVKNLPRKYDYTKLDSRYMDIIPHLNPQTQYELYSQNRYDGIMHHHCHCERLMESGMSNIDMTIISTGVKGLRDSGELPEIIRTHI